MTKELQPPKHLSEESKKIWNYQVTSEVPKGRLVFFQNALEYKDKADEMRSQIEREGLTFTTEKTKAIHKHPLIETEARVREQFLKLWKILNLDFKDLNE